MLPPRVTQAVMLRTLCRLCVLPDTLLEADRLSVRPPCPRSELLEGSAAAGWQGCRMLGLHSVRSALTCMLLFYAFMGVGVTRAGCAA